MWLITTVDVVGDEKASLMIIASHFLDMKSKQKESKGNLATKKQTPQKNQRN